MRFHSFEELVASGTGGNNVQPNNNGPDIIIAVLEKNLKVDPRLGCRIWRGGSSKYGKMKISLPELGVVCGPWSSKNVAVHRVIINQACAAY
jgi:hypothetical protein